MRVFQHDSRKLERSYYRRMEASALLAIGIHAAAVWLAPPYVPRPYTLAASPLRLVAAGRAGGGGFGASSPPSAPRGAPTADAPPRRSAPIVTEQLRLSETAPPREPVRREGRSAQGTQESGAGPGGDGSRGSGLAGDDETPPVFYAFDSPPRIIDRVVPEYPALARAQGREGSVILNANVDERGRVIRVWVAQATAPEILVEAAVDAMYRFQFAPGSQQGTPVKCTVAVPFNFRLNMHL